MDSTRWTRGVLAFCLFGAQGSLLDASHLAKIDKTIKHPPTVKSKNPQYCLLVFGPDAATRVWLVVDDDVAFVGRDGNNTQAWDRVAGQRDGEGNRTQVTFKIGDIKDGALLHREVTLTAFQLSRLDEKDRSGLPEKERLGRDPQAKYFRLQAVIARPPFRGSEEDGRILQFASGDTDGYLLFGQTPPAAPIIHFGGPWAVRLQGRSPLRLERDNDVGIGVGSAGLGAGTFAFCAYETLVPENAHPQLEINWPAKEPGKAPIRELFELKQRC